MLDETVSELASRNHPQTRQLFFGPGNTLVKEIVNDDDFADLVEKNPIANAVFIKKSCEVLVRHLYPGDSFSRNQNRSALGDLATAKVRHSGLTGNPDIALHTRL